MKAYVIFEGQAGLESFVKLATSALVNINAELIKRNNECKEIDDKLEAYRALPFFVRLFKEEPYYTDEVTHGRYILKRYRDELDVMVESANHATAIHIKNDDMDRLMGWGQ